MKDLSFLYSVCSLEVFNALCYPLKPVQLRTKSLQALVAENNDCYEDDERTQSKKISGKATFFFDLYHE